MNPTRRSFLAILAGAPVAALAALAAYARSAADQALAPQGARPRPAPEQAIRWTKRRPAG